MYNKNIVNDIFKAKKQCLITFGVRDQKMSKLIDGYMDLSKFVYVFVGC